MLTTAYIGSAVVFRYVSIKRSSITPSTFVVQVTWIKGYHSSDPSRLGGYYILAVTDFDIHSAILPFNAAAWVVLNVLT